MQEPLISILSMLFSFIVVFANAFSDQSRQDNSLFCAPQSIMDWKLDLSLFQNTLEKDDGSEAFALGVLYKALTLQPPKLSRNSRRNRFIMNAYVKEQTEVNTAAMYYLQNGRLNLPTDLLVEYKVKSENVQFKPHTKNKAAPEYEIHPLLSTALYKYLNNDDGLHLDESRHLFYFLLKSGLDRSTNSRTTKKVRTCKC